jgi:hypothetical protein
VTRVHYELVFLSVPMIVAASVFADHFKIVGLGRDVSRNLGGQLLSRALLGPCDRCCHHGFCCQHGHDDLRPSPEVCDRREHRELGNVKPADLEAVAACDSDYIFVLDRDSAIGAEGAQLAADVMNNDIINSTRAVQEGHMIVLAHPAAWYTAEGGITALDYILSGLEATIL